MQRVFLLILGMCLWGLIIMPCLAQEMPLPYYDYPFANPLTSRRTLTVEEAVGLALTNAAAYQQARFDEQNAAEDVRQARVALLPQFSVPLTYFGTTPSVVRQPDTPPVFSFAASSAINETSVFLNISGTLDVAGRLRAALRRSRELLAAARAGQQAARRNLVVATVDAYYGLALARQKRRLADETLALAEGVAKTTEELQASGENEAADVFRARTAALARRDELEQARLGEFAAMSHLRALTGLSADTYLGVQRITQDLPAAAEITAVPAPDLAERPEVTQLDAQRRAAVAEARAARAELFPQLTYSLNMGFDTADVNRLRQYSGGSALVSVTLPVFAFGASRSRERQARNRGDSLAVQRSETIRNLQDEYYTARAGALSAFSRIRLTRDGALAAQQNLNLLADRYRTRKSTILDLTDAQSSYAAARLSYYQALTDFAVSRVRLEANPLPQVTPSQVIQPATSLSVRPPEMRASAAPCRLAAAQAPAPGGLRLGLTTVQVQTLFPRLQIAAADEFGRAAARLTRADLNGLSDKVLDEAESVALEFVDGRLAFLRVGYPATNRWESKDEFLAQTADRLGLGGTWKPFYDWADKSVRDSADLRDLALECAGFRLSIGIGIEGLGSDQQPHFELEDVNAARSVKARIEGKKP